MAGGESTCLTAYEAHQPMERRDGGQILSDAEPAESLRCEGALRPADKKNQWQLV